MTDDRCCTDETMLESEGRYTGYRIRDTGCAALYGAGGQERPTRQAHDVRLQASDRLRVPLNVGVARVDRIIAIPVLSAGPFQQRKPRRGQAGLTGARDSWSKSWNDARQNPGSPLSAYASVAQCPRCRCSRWPLPCEVGWCASALDSKRCTGKIGRECGVP